MLYNRRFETVELSTQAKDRQNIVDD